jgi:N-acetylneuraminic acid mutarotase
MKFKSILLTTVATIGIMSTTIAQQWNTKAPMNFARSGHCALALNGLIYVFGGSSTITGTWVSETEVYNPATNTWTIKASIPTPRGEMACAVVNGKIYVIGGYNPAFPGNSYPGALSNVEEYNPITDTWVAKTPMPTSRSTLSACEINNLIYVVGDWPFATGIMEIYNPSNDSWATGISSITGRMNSNSAIKANNGFYFIAGKVASPNGNSTSIISNKNEFYDLASNAWSIKSDLPQATFTGSACLQNNKIHYIGGTVAYQPEVISNNHFIYDISSNTWTPGPSMPTARTLVPVVSLNNKIYAIGGTNSSFQSTSINEEFSVCQNNLSLTPSLNSVSTGNTIAFSATTTDPNPSYVWQSDLGQGFQTLNNFGIYSGANTATLNIANVQLSEHNQPIRVISTSGNCIDTSNVAVINILDTCITNVTVYDTLFTTVTDTLVINATITGLNPPNNLNTIKVFPNPANSHITINYGNFASMSGYTLKITNNLGQVVFTTQINQQSSYIDLSTWSGNGIYFVQIIDTQNNTIENRKIVIQ